MAWLGTGDQLAPVVVASAGALSFAWTVITSNTRTGALARLRHAADNMRQRRHAGRALGAGLIAILAAALQIALRASGLLPLNLALALSLIASLSGSLTLLLVIIGHIIARRESPMPIPLAIRAILELQKRTSERHRYSFGSIHIPSVSKLYVPRKAQSWDLTHHHHTNPHTSAGQTISLDGMLAQYRNLVVVSGPGGGKSTMASWVVGQSSQWWLNAVRRDKVSDAPYGPSIALYLHANDITQETLEESIVSRYSAVGIQSLTADIFHKRSLPGVDWLVFIDGVDEILQASQRSLILSTLGGYLAETKSPMRLIITSRPLSTGELAELHARDVGQVHLRPFDRDDIREFARNWFIARAEYGVPRDKIEESVDNFVNSVRHAGLEGMMRVPLLVAMAALIFEREAGNQLPHHSQRPIS